MRTRGFTLVEVMVALAVAGMALAAAYAVLASVADARTRAAAGRSAALAGPAARATLEGWLRAAALAEEDDAFLGTPGGAPERPLDALDFAVEDGGALHPGPRTVRLFVDPERGLLAVLAPRDAWSAERPDTLAVAPAAGGLAARYRTRLRGRPAWVRAWRSDDELPEGVELTLHPAPGAELPPVLRLPLAVPFRHRPDASEGHAPGT